MRFGRILPPATGRRLLRDAGPPQAWVVVTIVAAAPILGAAAIAEGAARNALIFLALAILTLPSHLDRTGWRIYLGMAWLAAEQQRRLSGLRLPRTAAGADRWLSRPDVAAAGLAQASALMTAGRWADARALVESYEPTDLEDPARIARMLAAIDGMETGRLDPTSARAAIAALPADLRRYHELSLAWSAAWVATGRRKPWREDFARASAAITTDGIPARFLVFGAVQELLLPIIGVVLVVVARALGWL